MAATLPVIDIIFVAFYRKYCPLVFLKTSAPENFAIDVYEKDAVGTPHPCSSIQQYNFFSSPLIDIFFIGFHLHSIQILSSTIGFFLHIPNRFLAVYCTTTPFTPSPIKAYMLSLWKSWLEALKLGALRRQLLES